MTPERAVCLFEALGAIPDISPACKVALYLSTYIHLNEVDRDMLFKKGAPFHFHDDMDKIRESLELTQYWNEPQAFNFRYFYWKSVSTHQSPQDFLEKFNLAKELGFHYHSEIDKILYHQDFKGDADSQYRLILDKLNPEDQRSTIILGCADFVNYKLYKDYMPDGDFGFISRLNFDRSYSIIKEAALANDIDFVMGYLESIRSISIVPTTYSLTLSRLHDDLPALSNYELKKAIESQHRSMKVITLSFRQSGEDNEPNGLLIASCVEHADLSCLKLFEDTLKEMAYRFSQSNTRPRGMYDMFVEPLAIRPILRGLEHIKNTLLESKDSIAKTQNQVNAFEQFLGMTTEMSAVFAGINSERSQGLDEKESLAVIPMNLLTKEQHDFVVTLIADSKMARTHLKSFSRVAMANRDLDDLSPHSR